MKTSDIFKTNASKLTESIEKLFGKKLNLETFNLEQLQDARNKLRTQVSQVRSRSGFNENLENEAFHQAQWMLDAINAEISEREEFFSEPHVAEVVEGSELSPEVAQAILSQEVDIYDILAGNTGVSKEDQDYLQNMYDNISIDNRLHPDDNFEEIMDIMYDHLAADYGSEEESVGYGESAPPTAKGERMVKHIKAAYGKDGKLTDKEKSIAYATAWKAHNKQNESVNTGDNMTKLNEGEIQQAQSIVTAKTMVDRIGRWIEELSGMENDNLLQLGDQIRDEMGQEQAKSFISTVAPAIQAALDNLKQTRETMATGVRILTGEEQGAEMLGAEPAPGGEEELGAEVPAAEPDAMNAGGDEEFGGFGEEEPPADEFGASDAAAGGLEAAGREKRESIEFQNKLMKVLAG